MFMLYLVAVKVICVVETYAICFIFIGVGKYGHLMYEIMYETFLSYRRYSLNHSVEQSVSRRLQTPKLLPRKDQRG
jgi:hypothetical protein